MELTKLLVGHGVDFKGPSYDLGSISVTMTLFLLFKSQVSWTQIVIFPRPVVVNLQNLLIMNQSFNICVHSMQILYTQDRKQSNKEVILYNFTTI